MLIVFNSKVAVFAGVSVIFVSGCSFPSPSAVFDDLASCQIDIEDIVTLDESVSYSFDGYEEGLEELGLDYMPDSEESATCDNVKSFLNTALESASREASIYVDDCLENGSASHPEVTSEDIEAICGRLSGTVAVYEELGSY